MLKGGNETTEGNYPDNHLQNDSKELRKVDYPQVASYLRSDPELARFSDASAEVQQSVLRLHQNDINTIVDMLASGGVTVNKTKLNQIRTGQNQ